MTRAFKDIIQAITKFPMFIIFTAWLDIRVRYRRSTLGPWWITLSMIIFTATLSIVYSRLMNEPLQKFIPYLGVGYAIWFMLSMSIIEGANVFERERAYVKQMNIPVSVYVLKLITRNLIIFLHNFVVAIALILFFKIPINTDTLLFIPGLILVLLNLYWVVMLLGILGARYRDIPPIINSLMQVLFLASPIAWDAAKLGAGSKIVLFNPVTYALDLVRSPLLGHAPMGLSWIVGIVVFVIGMCFTLALLNRYRTRIPYWVG
jgi:ABC-type polysaccharide/polyol phosphate export permease